MHSVREAGKKDPKYRKALEDLEKGAALAGPMPDGSNAEEEAVLPREEQQPDRTAGKDILGIMEGLLYQRGLLWVPDNKDLILKILESEHDTKVAGHMG